MKIVNHWSSVRVDGDFATATCTVATQYTPEDVYKNNSFHVGQLLAKVPSFLKVTGFYPPCKNELYLSVFGMVLVWEGNATSAVEQIGEPHFILCLHTNEAGRVICPHCGHVGTLFGWAEGCENVGCPQCGRSVTKLVGKL
jgi:hypothetical protein